MKLVGVSLWGQWRDLCDRITEGRLACVTAPLQAGSYLSLGGKAQMWVPAFGGCMVIMACAYPLPGCKPRCHPDPGPRRKRVRYPGPPVQEHEWRKDSPLQDGCAGRVLGLLSRQRPQNSERCLLLPPENARPQEFLCISQYPLPSCSGLWGT